MINERANIKTRDSRFIASKSVENLQRHVTSHIRKYVIVALPSRSDLNYSKSVPSTGYGHSKSDIFGMFDPEINEIEPSPFVETYERSADIPFKDNTLLWREVFAQMPEDQRGGDLKLDEFVVQPTSLTTPQAPLLDTNSSTSKGKGTDLRTEWSEWVWDDRQFWCAYRTNSTGALEYDYRYPVPENQQSTNRPRIELADPVYVTSWTDSIDDHDHETTPKSALISPTLANSYYKTPGREYSVSTSLSNTDLSNVSWPSRDSSTKDTLVSSNTSWAPSKHSALSEDSTIPDDLMSFKFSVLSEDLAPPIKSTVSGSQSMLIIIPLAPPNGGLDNQVTYQEKLDERYKIYGGFATQRDFWKVGRVFITIWTESTRPLVGETRNGSRFNTTLFGESAYSEMRRFVVLINGHGSSTCCPIQTYSNQASLKPNLPAPNGHAIIYTLPICPSGHYDEAHDGSLIYENLVLDPIRVDSERDDVDGQLHPLSRLNYSKVYTIEHYVRVLNIGMVASELIDTFMRQSGWPQGPRFSG